MAVDVVHLPDRNRFQAEVDGHRAVLAYEVGDGEVSLLHTVVPVELEGNGLGSRLAQAAVTWAEREGLRVVPVCSFVQAWLARHPDGDRPAP